jgi:hypothetical protein
MWLELGALAVIAGLFWFAIHQTKKNATLKNERDAYELSAKARKTEAEIHAAPARSKSDVIAKLRDKTD